MLLQNAPAAFNRIELAVVWRIVSQLNFQTRPINELHEAIHELRPRTVDLRCVVQIDHQFRDLIIQLASARLPMLDAISNKIAIVSLRPKDHVELITVHFQDARRNEKRLLPHVMADRLDL